MQNNLISEIFVSYIIPTIGRSSLDVAVKSVLTQDVSDAKIEVIVVNDSGNPLHQKKWFSLPQVRIINTNKCERSFARNSGAAIAKGEYLWFLDDDDWILPGALESLWRLAKQEPQAVWLYGGIQIVYEHGEIIGEINSTLNGNCFAQIMGGSWAPLQASIIKANAFFELGGFSPLISVTEDEDLCRRAAYHGDFANTSDTVACLYRGQSWKTSSNYLRAPEDVKYSRDLILSKPGVLKRLRVSADSSYWHGRILRIYLSTISWNLRRKRFFTAISRMIYSLAFLGLSVINIFSSEFWAGVKAHHAPETLHFVMKDWDRKNQNEEVLL